VLLLDELQAALTVPSVAVWENTVIVKMIVMAVWLLNLGYYGFSMSRVCQPYPLQYRILMICCSVMQAGMGWDSGAGSCGFSNTVQLLPNIIVALVCEATMLLVMFVGVLKKRSENKLWRLLYRQVSSNTHTFSNRERVFCL